MSLRTLPILGRHNWQFYFTYCFSGRESSVTPDKTLRSLSPGDFHPVLGTFLHSIQLKTVIHCVGTDYHFLLHFSFCYIFQYYFITFANVLSFISSSASVDDVRFQQSSYYLRTAICLYLCCACAYASLPDSATLPALAATSLACTSLGACSYLANSYI